MDPMRWDPFRDMAALRDRMNRMLEAMLSPSERRGAQPETWSPAVDIVETDQAIILRADVPGVSSRDLEIELDGDALTLRGRRAAPAQGRLLRGERPQGPLLRSFAIAVPIDQANVKAACRDGVLEITLPKAAHHTPRQVKVRVE